MRFAKLFLLGFLLLSIAGCGDSTSNNQGTSFTFFGYFNDSEGDLALSSATLDLGSDSQVVGFAGLQNNLGGQTIRTTRAFHDYFVPGSNLSIPSTSVGIGSPVLAAGTADVDSSLPDSLQADDTGLENIVFPGVAIVPTEIVEFLLLNQGQFPSTPFTLVVSSRVEGVTSAGDPIVTNDVQIDVLVTSSFGGNFGF